MGQRIQAADARSHEALPTGHEAKSSCRGAGRSVQKAQSYPRVPLVPRSTRGYFRATTPWFVLEGSASVR